MRLTPNRSDLNLNSPKIPFPVFDGLDINQMISACFLVHGTYYGVRSLWYRGYGEYQTLMPCSDKSNAPRYRLERNMNGFYLLDNKFEYDPRAQARMMGWINKQELPHYLDHPEISVRPFEIKLEEIALDMEIEAQWS